VDDWGFWKRKSALGDAACVAKKHLRIEESRAFNLTEFTGFSSDEGELENIVRPLLKITRLPESVGVIEHAQGRRILKTGARQYWVISSEDDDPLSSLRSAVAARVGTVTTLSHSRSRILLEGPASRRVLSSGVAIDFDPGTFAVDRFVLTGMHHVPLLIHRAGEDRYELYVLRTFALWVWELLIDASE